MDLTSHEARHCSFNFFDVFPVPVESYVPEKLWIYCSSLEA
jgi:hypothetical protein